MSSDNLAHVRPTDKVFFRSAGTLNRAFWNWIQLLAILTIPAAIIVGLLWFSTGLNQMEIVVSNATNLQNRQTNLQIAQVQEQDNILDTYLDRISALMLTNNLSHSRLNDEVRAIARDRTLATLLQLDGTRKGIVLQFLYQSNLITKGDVKVNLSGANLVGAKLRGAELAEADLSGANLSRADLTGADLTGTVLNRTNLSGATLPDGSTNS